MPEGTEAGPQEGESPRRLAPWWLLLGAIVAGAVLTAIADALGSEGLSALEWLTSTATIAALVVAVGIYRLQDHSSSEAHSELMDQLEAQNEMLNDFAKHDTPEEEGEPPEGGEEAEPAVREEEEVDPQQANLHLLTADQRAEIEDQFGKGSIAKAIDPGRGRGRGGSQARLVRLKDGRLASVYDKRGRTYVREIGEPRELRRAAADRVERRTGR